MGEVCVGGGGGGGGGASMEEYRNKRLRETLFHGTPQDGVLIFST